MSLEQAGGLAVIAGCVFLLAGIWAFFSWAGLIIGVAVLLLIFGYGMILVARQRRSDADFEKRRAEIQKRFEGQS